MPRPPRRSLRLRQRNGQIIPVASSSSTTPPLADKTSEPIDRTTKKRTRADEPNLEIHDANRPKQKKLKLSIVDLESLPNEILEEIFNRTDDFGFLNLANTCTRFDAIALAVASKRYSDRYFIINGY